MSKTVFLPPCEKTNNAKIVKNKRRHPQASYFCPEPKFDRDSGYALYRTPNTRNFLQHDERYQPMGPHGKGAWVVQSQKRFIVRQRRTKDIYFILTSVLRLALTVQYHFRCDGTRGATNLIRTVFLPFLND